MEKNETNEAAGSGKTVIVVDEQGTNYGATWPRRAKSLVKNGRARFISENTICLACPPDKENLEDTTMSDKTENAKITEKVKNSEVTPEEFFKAAFAEVAKIGEKKSAEAEKKAAKLDVTSFFEGVSLGKIVSVLELIAASSGHITGMAGAITDAVNNSYVLTDDQLDSMRLMVSDREATNQRTIAMLNKIYDEFASQLHS